MARKEVQKMINPKKRDQETQIAFILAIIVGIIVGVVIGFGLMMGAN